MSPIQKRWIRSTEETNDKGSKGKNYWMKIRIIGGPGSGKTFLAKKKEEELSIPHFDLDDLQWDNKADSYGIKRDPQEREELLEKILLREDWIIEGVYYKWCSKTIENADVIYVLEVPKYKYRFRILKRFIRRKLGLEKGKRETLKSLYKLLVWADKYSREDLPEIRKLLKPYYSKVVEL